MQIMDGDTSGGLAPMGGIDKHFLIEWLTWMASIRVPRIMVLIATSQNMFNAPAQN